MWILLSDPELAGHLHADLQPDLSDAADRHAGQPPLKGTVSRDCLPLYIS